MVIIGYIGYIGSKEYPPIVVSETQLSGYVSRPLLLLHFKNIFNKECEPRGVWGEIHPGATNKNTSTRKNSAY